MKKPKDPIQLFKVHMAPTAAEEVTKVLNIIGKNIGKKVSIVFKPKRKGEMQKTHGSNQYLKKIFKLKNFINFNIGIKKLIIEEKKYFNI